MAESRVGIIIDAQDKTGPGFKSAGRGVDSLKKKFEGLSKHVKSAPEQFGKLSAALLLAQNGASQMGGKFADAANKIGAVVSLVAIGGPLGAGLAVLTGIVITFTAVWSQINSHTDAVVKGLARVRAAVQDHGSALRSMNEDAELYEKLARMGVKSVDQQTLALHKANEARLKSIEALEKEKESLAISARQTGEVGDAARATISLINTRIDQENIAVEIMRRKIVALDKMEEAQRKANEAEKDAKKDASVAVSHDAAGAYDEWMKIEERKDGYLKSKAKGIADYYKEQDEKNYETKVKLSNDEIDLVAAKNEQIYEEDQKLQRKREEMAKAMMNVLVNMQTQTVNAFMEHHRAKLEAEHEYNKAKIAGDEKAMAIADENRKHAGRRIRNQILDIILSAALAAAAQAFAQAGPIAGIPMAAAATAAVMAIKAQVPEFAHGGSFMNGVVSRGTPGVDDQLIAVQRGERVNITPAAEVRSQQNNEAPASRGSTTVINLGFAEKPGTAQLQQFVRSITRERDAMARRGLA